MNEYIDRLVAAHNSSFPGAAHPRVFSCPGRINLIGEHVDYNGGHVFPAAIDRAVYLCVSENASGLFRFHDAGFQDSGELPLSLFREGIEVPRVWLYPAGALAALRADWDRGFDLSYLSTIPVGAGVSSSAAITTVTLFAMAKTLGMELDGIELARMGQRVEREYAGVACGIMDQFAVIHGRKDSAILLDTRDLSYEYLYIDPSRVRFVLVNSGVRHSLRESGYNDRRMECESALALLRGLGAKIDHLCDLSPVDFMPLGPSLPPLELRRARHAITENARTLEFLRRMRSGDFSAAGELLYASHASLRDDFEVSIDQMDRLVEWAGGVEGAYGSRMMGGGFGGCTVTMVDAPSAGRFAAEIALKFQEEYGAPPGVLECAIGDGVSELIR
ncbi:MAG TPA: galactokinase [Spirochaetota bacterium]|nr:MAG: Galactokinase [Spirochaetes bacterium ADurb.BinA120]HNU90245.1 galactokinase [Spirochaetota bacterium]HPI15882.1 galactokinase [Spirochaetota bacterium]HPO44707.1 galactokinase [Spirochaetota bacterium]HPV96368.1 galactokinase [Spirochaetota bacterium]